MPHSIISSLQERLASDKGQALVEYALILALIAILLLGALGFVQGNLASIFTKIATSL